MLRVALRSAPTRAAAVRAATAAPPPSSLTAAAGSRRLLSFKAAADKPRTWKGAAVRWGLALGALYWYNTSPLFADELPPQTIPAPPQFSDADLPTVESVIEQKRKEAEAKAHKAAVPPPPPKDVHAKHHAASDVEHSTLAASGSPEAVEEALEEVEEEASQQAAFDPETGEINWDCPCLGGMAHGPCGEEFKAAFSCFVHSKEETKGIDCIDKFQGMQECFRKYPEIYGAELGDEEDENGGPAPGPESEGLAAPAVATTNAESNESPAETTKTSHPSEAQPPPKPDAEKSVGEKQPSLAANPQP